MNYFDKTTSQWPLSIQVHDIMHVKRHITSHHNKKGCLGYELHLFKEFIKVNFEAEFEKAILTPSNSTPSRVIINDENYLDLRLIHEYDYGMNLQLLFRMSTVVIDAKQLKFLKINSTQVILLKCTFSVLNFLFSIFFFFSTVS